MYLRIQKCDKIWKLRFCYEKRKQISVIVCDTDFIIRPFAHNAFARRGKEAWYYRIIDDSSDKR